jgi:triacylglycerol lipase
MIFQNSAFSDDLSLDYKAFYKDKKGFTQGELKVLKDLRIVLVPGILSETFISHDHRSQLKLWALTSDYFGAQKQYFSNRYHLDIVRINSSSTSLEEIKANLDSILKISIQDKKKVLFITHSLGGIALMDYLISNQSIYKNIFGNIFLQSPFRGTPIANIYKDNRLFLRTFLKPILPYLNASESIANHLDPKLRIPYMQTNQYEIQGFVQEIPSLTIAATANNSPSLFEPAIDIIKYGCIRIFRQFCGTRKIYNGELDKSDGMVPLSSTFIENTDYVILKNVDHGETVVNVPFQNIDRVKMTESLIRIIIEKQD